MDDVMFSYDRTNGPESSTTLYLEEFARTQVAVLVKRQTTRPIQCLVEIVRVQHWE